MKGLSGFRFFLWFSVTSPVRNREVNSLEKLIELGDFQVEPVLNTKKKDDRNVEFGR